MASQYFRVWSTNIKLAWRVTRATRTCFLDYLSGNLITVRRDITARYAGFFRNLLSSPSREVQLLANIVKADIRSTTASNLRFLEDSSGGLTWKDSVIKIKESLKTLEASVVPPEDKWRLPYVGKLLEKRGKLLYEVVDEDNVESGRNSRVN